MKTEIVTELSIADIKNDYQPLYFMDGSKFISNLLIISDEHNKKLQLTINNLEIIKHTWDLGFSESAHAIVNKFIRNNNYLNLPKPGMRHVKMFINNTYNFGEIDSMILAELIKGHIAVFRIDNKYEKGGTVTGPKFQTEPDSVIGFVVCAHKKAQESHLTIYIEINEKQFWPKEDYDWQYSLVPKITCLGNRPVSIDSFHVVISERFNSLQRTNNIDEYIAESIKERS